MTIGSSVGPYRMLRHLGSGGMGEVWLAEDTRLHRQVALKMVRAESDPGSRDRLMREARAAAALNHSHIATVHDVLEQDGDIVIVFEYVEGETLQSRIARGPIPVTEAVDIASQIAKGLVHAHAQGIVHRDLKPANVIIGADRHVKILDFGVARMLALGSTQTHAAGQPQTASGFGLVGTPSYAAPEQLVSSAVDERADLYALGVVLFEMICGHRPFVGNDPVQLATRKLGTDAPPLSSTGHLVPPALEQLVASLLERERDRRPASANDVLAVLKHLYGRDSTMVLPRRQTRGIVTTVVASAVIVVLSGVAVWQWQSRWTAGNAATPVIAVLPLANLSGDGSRDYLAAGIAESLITSLAMAPNVTVLSRAAVAEARTRTADNALLVRDLGANYFVEGSVQESAGMLRVSLRLVRSNNSTAWAGSEEAKFEQVFALQTRLASALTDALAVSLTPADRKRLEAPPTTNIDALSAYWQGRALMERRDVKGNLDAAIAAFTHASSLDPKFATALAALGEAYWQRYVETRDQAWVTKAMDAGLNALRLDPQQPQVRYTLAITLAGSGRLDEAAKELRETLTIQPNYEDARRQLGQVLARQGHVEEAIAEFQKAIALRPASWVNWSAMGISLYQAGRYPEAADAFRKVTELQPDNMMGFQQLGTVNQLLGSYDEALRNYERVLQITPNAQAYTNIGAIHHLRGDYARAVEAYQKSLELRANAHVTWRNLGDVYVKLQRADAARAAYTRAIEQVESELKVDPNDASLLSVVAVYLAKVGRIAEADAKISAAVKALPADAAVHFRMAEVYALSDRPVQAVAALQRAIVNGMAISRIRDEEDFVSLRKLPAFTALLKGETR